MSLRSASPVHCVDVHLGAPSPVASLPVQAAPHPVADGPEGAHQKQQEATCHHEVREDGRHRDLTAAFQRLQVGAHADEAEAKEQQDQTERSAQAFLFVHGGVWQMQWTLRRSVRVESVSEHLLVGDGSE